MYSLGSSSKNRALAKDLREVNRRALQVQQKATSLMEANLELRTQLASAKEEHERWKAIAERTMDHQASVITQLGVELEQIKTDPVGYWGQRAARQEKILMDMGDPRWQEDQ